MHTDQPDTTSFAIGFNSRDHFVLVGTREGAAPRFLVPRRFTATGTPAESDVEVELAVEVDDVAAPLCVGLTLRARGRAISGDTLRKVPVARLMKEAVAAAAHKVQELPDGGIGISGPPRPADQGAFLEHHAKGARRPRRGSPLTESHLSEVAETYRTAIERSQPPTQAVADEMQVARSTAARWVAKAREAKLLGPAIPGRAGEASA